MQFEFHSLVQRLQGQRLLGPLRRNPAPGGRGGLLPGFGNSPAPKGRAAAALRAVLVTHEHSDHIRGLPLFAKRYGTPVYASYGTWASMQGQLPLPGRQRMEFDPDQDFYIDGVNVSPFPIPHDTPMPVGYSLECMGKKVSFATDLGHTTPKILGCVARSDVLLLEANHDVEMLKAGPYPYSLKKRILGRYGHLSNDACASAGHPVAHGGASRVPGPSEPGKQLAGAGLVRGDLHGPGPGRGAGRPTSSSASPTRTGPRSPCALGHDRERLPLDRPLQAE